jgi:hypothetical protein
MNIKTISIMLYYVKIIKKDKIISINKVYDMYDVQLAREEVHLVNSNCYYKSDMPSRNIGVTPQNTTHL